MGGFWQAIGTCGQQYFVCSSCSFIPPNYDGTTEGETATTQCLSDDDNTITWKWEIIQTTIAQDAPQGSYTIFIANPNLPYSGWSYHVNIDGDDVLVTGTGNEGGFLQYIDTNGTSEAHAKGTIITLGYWARNKTPVCYDVQGSIDAFALNLPKPTFNGSYQGQTTTTKALAKNEIKWKWHKSNYPHGPHLVTDPCPGKCGCTIFADSFDCKSDLQSNYKTSGDVSIESDDNSVLYGGTSLWLWNGSSYTLSSQQCLPQCTPAEPTEANPYIGSYYSGGCTPTGANANKSIYQWFDLTKQWKLINNYCFHRLSPLGGSLSYQFGDASCSPLQPTDRGEYDGQTQTIDCPKTGHLKMGSNSSAICNYGYDKKTDLYVIIEAINIQPADELKILFDNGKQYAYFKFGNWWDGLYPDGTYTADMCPNGDITKQPIFDNTTKWDNEGEFGIYDGTQLRKIHSSYLYPNSDPHQGRFLSLWLHPNENGDGTIATANIGGYSYLDTGDKHGPGWEFGSLSADVTIHNHQVGIGTGTNTGTYFDRFAVQQARRTYTNLDYSRQLTTSDSCYNDEVSNNDTYYNSYQVCNGGELERLGCNDGMQPVSIDVEISGFQPLWYFNIPTDAPGWSAGDYIFHTDPGTLPDNANISIYGETTTTLNGTYRLERGDLCILAGCSYGNYFYENTDNKPFTITVDIWNNLFVSQALTTLQIWINPFSCPFDLFSNSWGWYSFGMDYGAAVVINSSTTDRIDCFDGIKDQEASHNANTDGHNHSTTQPYIYWQDGGKKYAQDGGTITITGVNYV